MSSSHTWSRILALISTFNSNHVLNLSKIFELKLSPKNCPSLELTLQKPVEHSSLVSSSVKLLNTKPEPELGPSTGDIDTYQNQLMATY